MKKIYLLILILLTGINLFAQDPWANVPKMDMAGNSNSQNKSVVFKGELYIAGENNNNGSVPVLRKTADGNPGNWQDVPFNRGFRINTLSVSNEGAGYMYAAVDTNDGSGDKSAIFRTLDGINWQQISTFSMGDVNNGRVCCIMPYKGTGLVDSIYVVYSNNNGAKVYRTSYDNVSDTNWTLVCDASQLPGYNYKFNYSNDIVIWQNELCVLLNGALINSANGTSWNVVNNILPYNTMGDFSAAEVFDNLIYVGVNANSGAFLIRSSDLLNWQNIDNKVRAYSVFSPVVGTPTGKIANTQNGKIYGAAFAGGSFNEGAIYEYVNATLSTTIKKSFEYSTGTFCVGGLTLHPSGKIYGLASAGGFNESGTIFEYDPILDTLRAIHHFNAPDGSSPESELLVIGNTLYGTTKFGGASNFGVFFKYNLTTQTFTKLFEFDGGIKGGEPIGGLTYDGVSKIYGVTPMGGEFNLGTLYSFNILDSAFSVVYDFDGSIGSNPYYQPVFGPNGYLYGVASSGNNYSSNIYKFDTATAVVSHVYQLDEYQQGYFSTSSMILNPANNNFYFGVSSSYGNGNGNLLEFNPATNNLTTFYGYTGVSGKTPQDIFWEPNGDVFTICKNGSLNNYGSITIFHPNLPNPLPGFGDDQITEINELKVIDGELYLTAFGNTCGMGERKTDNSVFSGCDDQLIIMKSNTGDLFSQSYYVNSANSTLPGRIVSIEKLGINIYGFGSNYYGAGAIRLCTVGTPPVVSFPSNTYSCQGQTVILDAGNPGSTYSWNTGATSQTVNATNAGVYSVVVTSNDGCIAYAETQTSTHDYPDNMMLVTQQSHTLCFGDTLSASFTTPDMFPDRVKFKGTNGYIETYNFDYMLVDESFTVEVWVKPDTAGVVLTEQNDSDPAWKNNQIEIASNGDVWMSVKGLSPVVVGNIPFNQWSHLALKYSIQDSVMSAYINGVKSNVESNGARQKPFGFPNYGNQRYLFGKGDTTAVMNNSNYYKGRMANIKVWNYALSDSAISSTFQSLLGAGNSGLVLSYQMAEYGGTYLYDATNNYNSAYLYNDVSIIGPKTLSYQIQPLQGIVNTADNNFQFSPAVSTNYIVTASTQFGCSVTDSIYVFVPSININNSSLSLCEGESVLVSVDTSYSPTWTPATGLSAVNLPNVIATPAASTVYNVSDTLHGCLVMDSISVVVNQLPYVNLYADLTLCYNSSIYLEGVATHSGNWNPTLGIDDTTSASTFIKGLNSGAYTFTAIDPNSNCTYTDTLNITVNSLPNAEVGADTSLCDNLMLTFDASPIASNSFVWSSSDTTFTNNNDTVFSLPVSTNDYFIVVTDINTNCVNADTIKVTAFATDVVNISDDTAHVCTGTPYQLYSSGSSVYSWIPANDLSSSTSSAPVVIPSQSRWFYLHASDANGCNSNDSVFVNAKSLPVIKGTVKYDSLGTEVNLLSGKLLIFYGDTVGALDTLLEIGISNGQYFRDSIPAGQLALLSSADSSIYYPSVPSIYYGGTDNWNNVVGVSAGCEDTLTLDILHGYINPNFLNGTALIDGYLVEGIPFGKPGEPIRGIDIILEDVPGGGNQAFRKTDTSGYFSFQNVPDGNYQIRVNIPGREQDTVNYLFRVNTDGGVDYDSTVVFYFNDTLIFIRDTTFMDTLNVDPTSVKQLVLSEKVNGVNVFPNPGSGLFTIQVENVKDISNEINLYDVNGRLVSGRKDFAWINNKVVLDLRSLNLAPGVYYVKLKSAEDQKTLKLVIE